MFLGNELDDLCSEHVISALLYLDGKSASQDIRYERFFFSSFSLSFSLSLSFFVVDKMMTMYITPVRNTYDICVYVYVLCTYRLLINSPGGPVNPAMGVLDAITYCRSDVSTVGVGLVASSAVFALAAGTKGKRYAMPNTRIMIHQPLGDAGGLATQFEVCAKEMMFHKEHMAKLFASMVGRDWKDVDMDTDRDKYMSAKAAMDYGREGIIDEIIGGREAVFEMDPEYAEWVKAYDMWTPDREYDDDGLPILPSPGELMKKKLEEEEEEKKKKELEEAEAKKREAENGDESDVET